MNKPKVLFLCTGNSARSQMAEALLRYHAGGRFEAYSAGTEPRSVEPMAIMVMNEAGIDISSQASKDVKVFLGKQIFAYVIALCPKAQQSCPHVFPGFAKYLDWTMDDPAAFDGPENERLIRFRETRDEIERKIEAWILEVD